MKKCAYLCALIGFFLLLSFLYLSPAMNPLLESDVTKALSDGTDPLTAPTYYRILDEVARTRPLDLVYGAVPNRMYDAPEGSALWIPWIEKILSVAWSPWVITEQRGTIVVFCLYVLNGLSFFLMARSLRWPLPISLALAICWAFNPFTHARAKVHFAMVALYHLPLIFWGLVSLIKNSNRKGVLYASFAFLMAAMTFQYFVILTVAFVPFLLLFLWTYREELAFKKSLTLALIAGVPAVLFLAWSLLQPLPPEFLGRQTHHLPPTGVEKNNRGVHPFMEVFAAQPLDYLSGDIGVGINDLNPLKEMINEHIASHLGQGNTHERANGIRWWILALGFFIWVKLIATRNREPFFSKEQPRLLLFFGFSIWGFLLSLSPVIFGHAVGPSAWLHALIPQFRVPSRASIFVHFGCLMVAGYFLTAWVHSRSSQSPLRQKLLWILPLLALVSFPPLLNPLPLSPIRPVYSALKSSGETCETGMYFPYVSGTYGLLPFYIFIQRLRGTSCSMINSSFDHPRNQMMLRNFALSEGLLRDVAQDAGPLKSNFISFVGCTGLQWIVFDGYVKEVWRQEICQKLGWNLDHEGVCAASLPHAALKNVPENCLK